MWQSLTLTENISKLITSFQIPRTVQIYVNLKFHFKVLILFPFIILIRLHLARPHLLGTWGCQTFHFPLSTSFPAPAKSISWCSGCLDQAFGSVHQPLAANPSLRGNRAKSQTKLGCWQHCSEGAHTCFLSPPLGEFLHNLGVGRGLSNSDTKPKAIQENIEKFYYIKKSKASMWGKETHCKYKDNDPLGKTATTDKGLTSPPQKQLQ